MTLINKQINIVFLVDAEEGMFREGGTSSSPFQDAMQVVFNFYDDCMLRMSSSRNNLGVVVRHPMDSMRWLIDFDDKAADAYKKAFALKSRLLDDLRDTFLSSSEAYPLSTCLLDCFRRLPLTADNRNVILFMTVASDPSTNATERTVILNQLHNLHDTITFQVIPYSAAFRPDVFYAEAYASMKRPLSNYYFDVESLSAKLIDQVEYFPRQLKLSMYPYLGSETSITVFVYNPGANYKIYASKYASNETREEVVAYYEFEDDNDDECDYDADVDPSELEKRTYSVNIKDQGTTRAISHATYKALQQTADFPRGIVLVSARKERYSQDGLGLKMPRLLRCSPWSRNVFDQFWEAHRDLHLLCYIKYRTNCHLNCCELSPTLVGNERHFVVRFLPHATNLNFRNLKVDVDVEAEEPTTIEQVVNAEAINNRFEHIIDAMTIDFDVKQLRPTDDAKIVEYFKAELLGAQYQQKHVTDYLTEQLYPESKMMEKLMKDLAEQVRYPQWKK